MRTKREKRRDGEEEDEEEGVEHAVAVGEMVRTAREILRVGAVADVDAVGETRWYTAVNDGAWGRGELGDRGEVVGKDVAGIDGGPEERWVNEVVYDIIQSVAEGGGQ